MKCPNCRSDKFVKNGHTHYGKQRFRCQDCGRQFVNNPSRQPVSQEKRDLIDKLLKERLALAAMASPAPEAHRASSRGFGTLVAELCQSKILS